MFDKRAPDRTIRNSPRWRSLIYAANQDRRLSRVLNGFSVNVLQVLVTVDNAAAQLHSVTQAAVYSVLQASLDSEFVNDFVYKNFVFQFIVA